jgi:transcriptional regulator with XRE-family HTH domain
MKERKQVQEAMQRLGEFVRTRRQSLELSLSKAGELADVDRTYWRRLEDGEYQDPSPRVLARVAEVLDVRPTDLFVLAGFPIGGELPGFGPYLRSKFHLPPEAIDQLESYFAFMRAQYGIPDDQPVFPPKDDKLFKTQQVREPGDQRAA